MVVLMCSTTLLALAFAALAQETPASKPEERKPDRIISISAERFTFNPSRITVKQGELIEFVLTSDDTDHGFRMRAAGIDVAIPPSNRGEVRVRFVAKEKGRFVFECSRPCGAGHNIMRGTVTVE